MTEQYQMTRISGVGYPTYQEGFESRQAFIDWFETADIDDGDVIVVIAK